MSTRAVPDAESPGAACASPCRTCIRHGEYAQSPMPVLHPAAAAPLAAQLAAAEGSHARAGQPSAARSAPVQGAYAECDSLWCLMTGQGTEKIATFQTNQGAASVGAGQPCSTRRVTGDGSARMDSHGLTGHQQIPLSSSQNFAAAAAAASFSAPASPDIAAAALGANSGCSAAERTDTPRENRRPRWPTGSKLASRGVLEATPFGTGLRVGRRSLPASMSKYASRA